MSNFIDRYTQIDELLRKNLKAQQDTNKLLAALLGGYKVAIPQGITQVGIGGEQYKTTIRTLTSVNTTIATKKLIFGAKYGGILEGIYFLSDVSNDNNNNYKVKILSDGEVAYENTWTEFNRYSNYEKGMTAFYDDDNYVIIFQDIAFTESLLIEVIGTTINKVTFHKINIKIHKKL